ncbi:7412_t:CDS:2, partial [Gigaspora margarita]
FNASNSPFQLLAMLKHKRVSSAVAYKDELIFFGLDKSQGGSSNDLIIINETSNYSLNIVENTDINMTVSKRFSYGTMYKFDILNYSWAVYNASTQPICRVQHTATMTLDGTIIMIGGLFNPEIAQKANIIGRVYTRWGHTATLTTNNQSIIISGDHSNSTSSITDIA